MSNTDPIQGQLAASEQPLEASLRSALLGHLSRAPRPETGAISAAADIIFSSHHEWLAGDRDEEGTCLDLVAKIAAPTTVLAEMFHVNDIALPASWGETPENERTVLAMSGHIELGYLQAAQVSLAHDGGNPRIGARIREVTQFVRELQQTSTPEGTLPQQPEPEAGQGIVNDPGTVVAEYLSRGVPPRVEMIHGVADVIHTSYKEYAGSRDALGVCVDLSQRFPDSYTAVLAAMFATGHTAIPEHWRANPEITRTVLSMSGYIEAGILRARQISQESQGNNDPVTDANLQNVRQFTEALQQGKQTNTVLQ